MKIKNSSFVISAVAKTQYPDDALPEFAFAGRSNVGKSSLINMLLNRRGLAKTSSTPGKTQLVNFYDIDGLFRFVDLPGYGFAKVSKAQKATWGSIIETYLNNRETLLEVFQLVDIRHKPTNEDKEMYDWIRTCGFNGIVLATKSDKLNKNQIVQQLKMIKEELEMEKDAIIVPVSSQTRDGKYDVWDIINALFETNEIDIHLERQNAAEHK
ncbi:MAG TPA: YihA family ribosome biogenesis GTP-binding protein [Clostridiales bacterium UBA8960]|jgi:GTP-binding protein|nr:YihA family ribosome biogenesis GTP-binding protein [Clostridiales bacterium UBA8960]